MKLNRGASQTLQVVGSPGLVFVMLASMQQNNIYKVSPNKFVIQLAKYSVLNVLILTLVVGMIYTLGLLKSVPSEEAQEMKRWEKNDSFELLKFFLYLVSVFSFWQYFYHRNETKLGWWQFFIAYFVATFISFLAAWGYHHLTTIRLKSVHQTEKILHKL